METILITGHEGFIGKNLFRGLIQSISADGDFSNIGINHPDWGMIGLEMKDYFTPISLLPWQDVLKKKLAEHNPKVIFHVGAIADTLNNDVNFMMSRNYEASRIISDWCAFNNVPLIYSSSAACYGNGDGIPMNIYGWSKYTAEQHIIRNGGVALRYFNVYGPHEEHKGAMASVAYQMYMKNKNGEKIKLFPEKPRRDFIYVDDVVRANMHAFCHYESLKGKVYDVGTAISHEFEYIMDLLKINYEYHNASAIPNGYQYFTSSNREKWMPLWSPLYSLSDGIEIYKHYLMRKNKNENNSNRRNL